jgi:hypothetical protein
VANIEKSITFIFGHDFGSSTKVNSSPFLQQLLLDMLRSLSFSPTCKALHLRSRETDREREGERNTKKDMKKTELITTLHGILILELCLGTLYILYFSPAFEVLNSILCSNLVYESQYCVSEI